MKSLLLVAHGSRREASNEEVRQLTERLSSKIDAAFDRVECAFLELAEPSIPGGLQQLIEAGAMQITVLPYFLSAGRHVSFDIPDQVDEVRKVNPAIEIILAPYLGAADGLTELLLQHAKSR